MQTSIVQLKLLAQKELYRFFYNSKKSYPTRGSGQFNMLNNQTGNHGSHMERQDCTQDRHLNTEYNSRLTPQKNPTRVIYQLKFFPEHNKITQMSSVYASTHVANILSKEILNPVTDTTFSEQYEIKSEALQQLAIIFTIAPQKKIQKLQQQW